MSLGEKIKKLRDQGYTYNEIAQELECAKSTVCYHLGDGQKAKSKKRFENIDPITRKIIKKVDHFKRTYRVRDKRTINVTHRYISKSITDRPLKFQRGGEVTFVAKDVYEKYGDVFKCALTGRKLHWHKPDEYEYDHIIPASKGGSNTLDNLQIVCKDANRCKSNLMPEEFMTICEEVLVNAGYVIQKPS